MSKILGKIATGIFLFAAVLSLATILNSFFPLLPRLGKTLAPMPINMGFVLLLSAVSLLLLQQGKTTISFAVGFFTSVFGAILFAEFVAHEDFGASELLFTNPFEAKMPIYQLPLGSALAIFLIGIIIFSLAKCGGRRFLLIIPALAAVGIIGASGIEILAGILDPSFFSSSSGRKTETIIFFLLAQGVIFHVAQELHSRGVHGRALLPIKAGGIFFLIVIALWRITNHMDGNSIQQKLEETSRQQALMILDQLAVDAKYVRKLAAQFPAQEGVARDLWVTHARGAAADIAEMSRIELLNNQMVSIFDLPLKTAKRDEVENIKWTDMRDTLLHAVLESKQVQFSPVGSEGKNASTFMVAAPIVVENRVAKLLLVTFQTEEFFKHIRSNEGIHFDVWQKSNPIFSSPGSGDTMTDGIWVASTQLLSQRENWSLRVRPSVEALRSLESKTPSLLLVLGIILSLIVAVAFHYSVLSNDKNLDAAFYEKKFQTTADLMPLCLIQTDAKGNLLMANSSWTKLTGQNLKDSLSQGWKDGIHPDDRESVNAAWNKGAKEEVSFFISFRVIAKNGTECVVSGPVVAIKGGAENSLEFVSALGLLQNEASP